MAVHTILLDFSVHPDQVNNENKLCVIFTNVENVLRDYLTNMNMVNSVSLQDSYFKLYTCDRGATCTLRAFNNGLITINIDYYKAEKQEPLISYEVITHI